MRDCAPCFFLGVCLESVRARNFAGENVLISTERESLFLASGAVDFFPPIAHGVSNPNTIGIVRGDYWRMFGGTQGDEKASSSYGSRTRITSVTSISREFT